MNVKGFILEDDQGKEFVLTCEQPCGRVGRAFSLRGWQRRRLVPLRYSERELRQIVGKVLITLDDLFTRLPRFPADGDDALSHNESFTTPRLRKMLVLRKVGETRATS